MCWSFGVDFGPTVSSRKTISENEIVGLACQGIKNTGRKHYY